MADPRGHMSLPKTDPEDASAAGCAVNLAGKGGMSKVWFVTGASRGLGRVWVEAALRRGDKVAATARTADDLAALKATYGDAVLPLVLDVIDRQAGLRLSRRRSRISAGSML